MSVVQIEADVPPHRSRMVPTDSTRGRHMDAISCTVCGAEATVYAPDLVAAVPDYYCERSRVWFMSWKVGHPGSPRCADHRHARPARRASPEFAAWAAERFKDPAYLTWLLAGMPDPDGV